MGITDTPIKSSKPKNKRDIEKYKANPFKRYGVVAMQKDKKVSH